MQVTWFNRSVGATVVEMLKGHPPWFEYEPTAAMFKIVMNDTKPDLPHKYSKQATYFLELCFIKWVIINDVWLIIIK